VKAEGGEDEVAGLALGQLQVQLPVEGSKGICHCVTRHPWLFRGRLRSCLDGCEHQQG